LVISAASAVQYPPTELSHILMVGRSNVGKSSIINALTQRKKLAYVGNKPGKTTLLNFYNINNEFMLVDAPGYGYANRTRGDLIRYGKMMDEFFRCINNLMVVLMVVDIRRKPNQDDLDMLDYLRTQKTPFILVINKLDKVSGNERVKQLRTIREELKVSIEQTMLLSTVSKQGIEQLKNLIIEKSLTNLNG